MPSHIRWYEFHSCVRVHCAVRGTYIWYICRIVFDIVRYTCKVFTCTKFTTYVRTHKNKPSALPLHASSSPSSSSRQPRAGCEFANACQRTHSHSPPTRAYNIAFPFRAQARGRANGDTDYIHSTSPRCCCSRRVVVVVFVCVLHSGVFTLPFPHDDDNDNGACQ